MLPNNESALAPVAFTANSWESPLATLRLTGPAALAGMDLIAGNEGEQIYPERIGSGNLVIIQRDFPNQVDAYARVVEQARAHGLPVVIDLDDLLFELPDDHPDRATYYYSRALFPTLQAIIEADAITASTQPLCDYLKRYNPNVWLLPNYLDDRLWTLRPVQADQAGDQPVRLAYMGGSSHTPDLAMVGPVLLHLLEKYNQKIHLRFFGVAPSSELLSFPNVEYEPLAEFNYVRFAQYFLEQDVDIFFAPLKDNLFNRSKSAIKFLEYSALGVPGVYSRLPTYEVAVRHGENGFLAETAEEWQEYLSRLIESHDLRVEMGRQAQATVRENWLLSEHAWQWGEAYSKILSGEGRAKPVDTSQLRLAFRMAKEIQARHASKEQELLAWGQQKELMIQNLQATVADLQATARDLQASFQEALQTSQALSRDLELHKETVRLQKNQIEAANAAIAYLNSTLHEVYNSTSWKLVQQLWKLRLRVAPTGSPQERWMRSFMKAFLGLRRRPQGEYTQDAAGPAAATALQPSPAVVDSSKWVGPIQVQYESNTKEQIDRAGQSGSRKYDVIVLPVIDWSFRFQRPQQIAVQFARAGHRIFYGRTTLRNEPHPLVKWIQENVFEIWLPGRIQLNVYSQQIDDQTLATLEAAFEALRLECKIDEAICVVDLPFWTPLALRLRERFGWKVVYDCMDYHAGFSTNTSQQLSTENQLTRESDLVVVTSHLLESEKSGQSSSLSLIENAGEFQHFRYPPVQPPRELRNLPKPVIGYYGAIADWFDTALVRKLALARPEWSFVLIGRTAYADLKPLEGLQNVHLLGEMPYAILPQYLHTFDVAIIPFKQTPLTDATNPVKLFEYLSAGKAVVATRLHELTYYQDYARLASTPEEWLDALEQSLRDYSPAKVKERVEFARQNTWEERFSELSEAVNRLYPRASVILHAIDQLDYLQLCLESLTNNTLYPNYEIIVIDQGLPEENVQLIKDWAGTQPAGRVLYQQANPGSDSGLNLGASLASGEVLIFLSASIVVTPGWLPSLTRHVLNPDTGAVSPQSSAASAECRATPEYATLQELDDFARQHSAAHESQEVEMHALDLACAAMRRSVYQETGPFDRSTPLVAADYARRLQARGLRVVCAQDVFIHRWEEAATGASQAPDPEPLASEPQSAPNPGL